MWKKVFRYIFLWIYQFPQNGLGLLYFMVSKALGKISGVEKFAGVKVIKTTGSLLPLFGGRGVTLGHYIIGNKAIEANPSNELFQHEFGHYLQSKESGWFYLSKFGLPSAWSAAGNKEHYKNLVEQDANIRAFEYFQRIDNKNCPTTENETSTTLWDRENNVIVGFVWDLAPTHSHNWDTLRKGRLQLAWYDYLLSPFNMTIIGIIVPGIINAIILYNKQ